MVASWAPPVTSMVAAVGQHHERADGQGFPFGLRAEATHPDAQVLGLVDCYAEWTSLPVRGRRHQPHEVVRELVRWRHGVYAPALVKALLAQITVFPPGSIVSLTTGQVGRVRRVNRRLPLRPEVQIISLSEGQRERGPRTIDLAQMPLVAITSLVETATSPN
jgi:HD-GYP domain-containing protein (c-di-GMP phosphodiesterase class II)